MRPIVKFMQLLLFLVQPEDTTEISPENDMSFLVNQWGAIVYLVKAVLWIVMGIVFTLFLAKVL